MTLNEIRRSKGYWTDKGAEPDHGNAGHDYLVTYEMILPQYKQADIILEIGVGCGGSMYLWRDYFERARIIGLETNSGSLLRGEDRIMTLLGSGTDPAFTDTLHWVFDVIIDDGSHRLEDQRKSLQLLWPKLKKGGLYCIEDVLPDYVAMLEQDMRALNPDRILKADSSMGRPGDSILLMAFKRA